MYADSDRMILKKYYNKWKLKCCTPSEFINWYHCAVYYRKPTFELFCQMSTRDFCMENIRNGTCARFTMNTRCSDINTELVDTVLRGVRDAGTLDRDKDRV